VNCFVTGQGSVGGGIGENDVDGGKTTLVSPVLDVTGMTDPSIGYWRWYSNNLGGAGGADLFRVEILNDDDEWEPVETIGPTGPETVGGWFYHSVQLSEFVTQNTQVQLRFIAEDAGSGSIIEAAVDDVVLLDCTDCDAFFPTQPNHLNLNKVPGFPETAMLSWNPVIGTEVYNVYRGEEQDATDLECYEQVELSTTLQDDGLLPAAGTALHYVISSGNCRGESGLGSGRVPVLVCP